MLFNSFLYLLFFPVVCLIYWLLPNKYRVVFLVVASYVFYLNWEPIYALLLLFITLTSWICGIFLEKKKTKKKRKIIFIACLISVLGILFTFKYSDFISHTINDLLSFLHISFEIPFLRLLLPVGISFYTFQASAYVIDVYKGKIKAERNILVYTLFVSFFPQLLAGPIGRGKNLIPQFYQIHKFNTNYFTEGARLILWGYFMKVVVSDRLATYVDSVFNNIAQHNSSSLIVASVFFSFQIYCDFGGYSNIAIGCAKIMGFDLMTNFRRPYMATSVTDFWRRWHISLSTWFRDYLYIPLGGNRCSKKRNYFNLMVTFVVSGLWHGASWTFVIWGGINGLFQILIDKTFKNTRNRIQSFLRMDRYRTVVYYLNVLFTFILITIAWVFFKARTLSDAFLLFDRVLSHHGPLFTVPMQALMYGSIFSIVLIVSDFIQEKNDGKHFFLENERAIVRYISYLLIVILILMFGVFDGSQFIYFQF